MNPNEYLSLKKASGEYCYSIRSLYRLKEKKLLQFYKIRGRTLIRRDELEILILPQPIF